MSACWLHQVAAWLLAGAVAQPLTAQVFSSEFFSDPVSEGWQLAAQNCAPELWVEEGWYHQQLDLEFCRGRDAYHRSLESHSRTEQFFMEARLQSNGGRSEIPYGAPTVLAMGNFAGVVYHLTVARDLVKFLRDVDLPIWFIGIEPDIPHTYRIELRSDWYEFYIDGYLIDKGIVNGPFPANKPLITWQGQAWNLPCHNAWDYIRYGVIPEDASGDYNGDTLVGVDDFYFVHECLANDRPGIKGGPDNDAGPGCRFADFDLDTDTDLFDFAQFQNAFGSAE